MKLCPSCMKQIEDHAYTCPYCGYEDRSAFTNSFFLPTGTVLNNRYYIGKVLGHGGFGITYIGKDLVLGRIIAIKEFYPTGLATRERDNTTVRSYEGEYGVQFHAGLDKFIAEARRLAEFGQSEGIVQIYDCIRANNTGYIVMEYLRGSTIKDLVKRGRRFTFEEAVNILLPVLNALEAVHSHDIIHRDIAPDNIIITSDGKIRLIDFGAAHYVENSDKTVSVILKHGFAPEEQYAAHPHLGPWTDVYGVSATLYYMVTGRKPVGSIERLRGAALEPPSALNSSITQTQESVILKGMAVRAEDRYQSADEMKVAILRCLKAEQKLGTGQERPAGSKTEKQLKSEPTQERPTGLKTGMQLKPGTGQERSADPNTGKHSRMQQTGDENTVKIGRNNPSRQKNSTPPRGGVGKIMVVLGLAIFAVLAGIIGIIMVRRPSPEPAPAEEVIQVAGHEEAVDEAHTEQEKPTNDQNVSVAEETADSVDESTSEGTMTSTDTKVKNDITVPTAGAKVGVSMPDKDNERWYKDGTDMEKELTDAGYEVDLQFAFNDSRTQLDQIKTMVEEGCDVLVIAAIAVNTLGEALDMTAENDIPVIAYDRLIMNTDAVSYYVTFDPYLVGAVQGSYIKDSLNLDNADGPFRLEITAGDPDDANAQYYYYGAMDILQPYIDMGKLVVSSRQGTFGAVATFQWRADNAQSRAWNILSAYYKNNNVDAWLCSNDRLALGVENALAANYSGKYPIVTGLDCDIENVKNIIEGKQSMSVLRDTRIPVTQIVKMVEQIINGEEVDVNDTESFDNGVIVVPTYLCESVYVDAYNYKELLIDTGYYTENDLR